MFNQAAVVALRISLFRAGPQDFPHSPALTRFTVALALLAAFLQYRMTLTDVQAVVHAVVWVAALAAFTYVLLQPRGLLNRLRQTLDSLYLTGSVLTLLMLPPLYAIAPYMARVADNPDLARTEPLPALPALLVTIASFWNFLIWAHIYRHALDARPAAGALVALLATVITVSLAGAVGALLS